MNVRGLSARLSALERELDSAARGAVAEAAGSVRADARELAPVETGRLRDSIRRECRGLRASVGTDCEYAPAVEFGTGRSEPRPFLSAAASAGRSRFPREARRAALEAIRRARR